MKRVLISVVLSSIALAGCQYAGPPRNPVSRNLSWFDYVGVENLKAAFGPGASDRLRFVYNGIYDEQIRSYDVRSLPRRRGAALSARARGGGYLTKGIELPNLLSPWQGTRVESVIDPQTFANLETALQGDRFMGFKPVGLRLPSNEFYWVVTGRVDGRLNANALLYPSDQYKSLKFHKNLIEQDKSGVEFSGAVPPARHETDSNVSDGVFWLQLGPNGVVGARGRI